jgi:hypothetical protein
MVSKELQVKVSANTQMFKQQMQAAGTSLNNFNSRLTDVAKVAAAPLALTGLTAYAMSVTSAADQMFDLSQKTGVAYDRLQILTKIPDLGDLGAEGLAKAFKDAQKSITEAQDSTSNAAKIFDTLGISIRNSDGTLKNAEQVIIDSADAFSKLEDSTLKTQIATELYGKSGAELIPFLNAGTDAINDQIKSITALSFTYSEELAGSMGQFNDNIDLLKTNASAYGNSLSSGLISNLSVLTSNFLDSANANNNLSSTFETGLKYSKAFTNVVFSVSQGLSAISAQATLARAGLNDLMSFVTFGEISKESARKAETLYKEYQLKEQEILEESKRFRLEINKNENDMIFAQEEAFNKKMLSTSKNAITVKTKETAELEQKLSKIFDKTKTEKPKQEKETKKEEDANAKAIQQLIDKNYQLTYGQEAYDLYKLSIAGATSEQIKQYEALQKINGQAEKEIELKKEASEIIKASQTEQEKYSETLYRYDELMLSGYLSAEQYQKAVLKLNEEFQKSNEKTVEMSEFSKEAAKNIQDAFAEFLFDPFASSANNMAINFINVIKRMVAEQAAAKLLTGLNITGKIDSGLGMLGGLFDFNAGGGYVPSNSLSVVGERGPEIIKGPAYVQDTAGSAYALSQQSNNGKSGNIVINNNINANDMIAFMSSTAGQKVITNAVSANKQKLKGVLR